MDVSIFWDSITYYHISHYTFFALQYCANRRSKEQVGSVGTLSQRRTCKIGLYTRQNLSTAGAHLNTLEKLRTLIADDCSVQSGSLLLRYQEDRTKTATEYGLDLASYA